MTWRTDHRPLLDRDDLTWRNRFVLAAEAVTSAERNELARRVTAGRLDRIRRGTYRLPVREEWPDERHRDLVRAASLDDIPRVFGLRSAAAVWRLPRLDPWPSAVDIVEFDQPVRRSTEGLRRHRTSVGFDTELLEGVRVTSLVRTVIDLARHDSTASALVAVDAALAGIRFTDGTEARATRELLLAELERLRGSRGTAGAAWIVAFADGLAELPGESLSRLQVHRSGLTAPLLQHPFHDDEGDIFPDFWWPDYGVAGEFDGLGKYLPGGPAELTHEVVMREKHREDRLRRLDVRVARWGWPVALDRHRLRSLLTAFGVR